MNARPPTPVAACHLLLCPPRSYGVPGADQQHQGQAPGNPRSQETTGGADHESGKPGPQSKQRTFGQTVS